VVYIYFDFYTKQFHLADWSSIHHQVPQDWDDIFRVRFGFFENHTEATDFNYYEVHCYEPNVKFSPRGYILPESEEGMLIEDDSLILMGAVQGDRFHRCYFQPCYIYPTS